MKTSTKVAIALGVAAAAGTTATVIASGKVFEKVKHLSNRCKVKKFVNDKFDGNEKLLGIVDDLSDSDLDSMMSVLGKVKDGRKKISVYGENLKDSTEDLKDRLLGFVDTIL
ncbi:hypothetical protein [Enterococcus phoeniculicola]|uniref:Uncharacterized protein n=1 Tax=Enterococcus phoeniculicola ATCC BAA-412 TaxID=1158610 RepID=R3TRD0_9ENTE|nr:hypothetical protein [Enterococcus phoeniculicola]EOL44129.1 hypothetical protein UC3_01759 [Enterococcus phoeniculicola ATCC BAA-412]EOT75231.1 hypothetical protein I589_02831 [Enterococcus phoeniculicola ATCC BAA-412]